MIFDCIVLYCTIFYVPNSTAGEVLSMSEPLIERQMHPAVIVRGFAKALDDAVEALEKFALPIDTSNEDEMIKVVNSCLGTKMANQVRF